MDFESTQTPRVEARGKSSSCLLFRTINERPPRDADNQYDLSRVPECEGWQPKPSALDDFPIRLLAPGCITLDWLDEPLRLGFVKPLAVSDSRSVSAINRFLDQMRVMSLRFLIPRYRVY